LNVEYRRKFLKDLASIPSKVRREIEEFAFTDLPRMNSVAESRKLERMKGYPTFYKVRFGSYRIGIKLEDDVVVFETVLHRRDIYRYFP
jgi:mRNA interferase RelE/StbE